MRPETASDDLASSRLAAPTRTLGLGRGLLDLARLRLDDPHGLAVASVLPAEPDDPPREAALHLGDLVVAGRYVPAGAGSEPIAGDFYDLLHAGPDRLALVVGDVSGHGPVAAARMQALRDATRAVALEQLGPRASLAALDVFLDQQPDEGLATLWYGEYAPSTGLLTCASAGHPPPVLAGPGGPVLLALADAPPLGTGATHALAREHTVHLPEGAFLIAYTDGLVERHDADLDEQLALLRELVSVHSDPALDRTPQEVADAVLAALVPDPTSAQDDVCLMVVRRRSR